MTDVYPGTYVKEISGLSTGCARCNAIKTVLKHGVRKVKLSVGIGRTASNGNDIRIREIQRTCPGHAENHVFAYPSPWDESEQCIVDHEEKEWSDQLPTMLVN